MTAWVSPLPSRMARMGVKLFRPTHDLRKLAEAICDRAWKGRGVRVFGWPGGTVAVVTVASDGDALMLVECVERLLATYARHGLSGVGGLGEGPKLADVMDDLAAARMAGEGA